MATSSAEWAELAERFMNLQPDARCSYLPHFNALQCLKKVIKAATISQICDLLQCEAEAREH